MITSRPPGRLSTQTFLNPNTLSVSHFLTLRTMSGSHSSISRLRMFKIVCKPVWQLHFPSPVAPFWRSKTTILNNRVERGVHCSSLELRQAYEATLLRVHFLPVSMGRVLCHGAWQKNLGRKTFTFAMYVCIKLSYLDSISNGTRRV